MGSAFADGIATVVGSNGVASSGGTAPNVSLTSRVVAAQAASYTLLAGDVGSLQVMTAATIQTFTLTSSLSAGWWCDLMSSQSQVNIGGAVTINGSAAGLAVIPYRVIRVFCVSPGNFITSEVGPATTGSVVIQGSAQQSGVAPATPGNILAVSGSTAWVSQPPSSRITNFSGSNYNCTAADSGSVINCANVSQATIMLGSQAAGWWIDIAASGGIVQPNAPTSILGTGGTGATAMYFNINGGQTCRLVSLGGGSYVMFGIQTVPVRAGYFLRDTGPPNAPYFALVPGQILGVTYVPTSENATSTTPVDLATPDSVTFTLYESHQILVEYCSEVYHSATGALNLTVFLDGTQQGPTVVVSSWGGGAGMIHALKYPLSGSIAAGSHTVNIKHHVSAGTGTWLYRSTKVSVLS